MIYTDLLSSTLVTFLGVQIPLPSPVDSQNLVPYILYTNSYVLELKFMSLSSVVEQDVYASQYAHVWVCMCEGVISYKFLNHICLSLNVCCASILNTS